MGAIFGLIIDILGSNIIGINSVLLGLVGFFGGHLEKNLSKDSKITILLLVMGFTAGHEIILYLYKSAMLGANVEIDIFSRKLFIEIVYNTLITIILYPLIQKCGYKVEEIFKNPEILTRYF